MDRPFCTPTFYQKVHSNWWAKVNDFWLLFETEESLSTLTTATGSDPSPSSSQSSTLLGIHSTCSEESIFVWIPVATLVILSLIELNGLYKHQAYLRHCTANGTLNGKHDQDPRMVHPSQSSSVLQPLHSSPLTVFEIIKRVSCRDSCG